MNGLDTARTRWRCRRGIKELDVLLERFTEECLPGLSPGQIQVLDRLLDESDNDLLDWIFDRNSPRSPEYLSLLDMLRGLRR